MRVSGEYVNIRVSVIPTVFGEKAVLRLLGNNSNIDYPETFGMHEEDYKKLRSMLGSPMALFILQGLQVPEKQLHCT